MIRFVNNTYKMLVAFRIRSIHWSNLAYKTNSTWTRAWIRCFAWFTQTDQRSVGRWAFFSLFDPLDVGTLVWQLKITVQWLWDNRQIVFLVLVDLWITWFALAWILRCAVRSTLLLFLIFNLLNFLKEGFINQSLVFESSLRADWLRFEVVVLLYDYIAWLALIKEKVFYRVWMPKMEIHCTVSSFSEVQGNRLVTLLGFLLWFIIFEWYLLIELPLITTRLPVSTYSWLFCMQSWHKSTSFYFILLLGASLIIKFTFFPLKPQFSPFLNP
jgi:hypothetical protein